MVHISMKFNLYPIKSCAGNLMISGMQIESLEYHGSHSSCNLGVHLIGVLRYLSPLEKLDHLVMIRLWLKVNLDFENGPCYVLTN